MPRLALSKSLLHVQDKGSHFINVFYIGSGDRRLHNADFDEALS